MKRKLILSLSTLVTVFVPVLSVVACEFEDSKNKGYDEDLITSVKDEINAWFFYGREGSATVSEIVKIEENANGGFDSSKTEQEIDEAISNAATKDLSNLVQVLGLEERAALSQIKLNGVLVDWKVKFKKQSHDYDVEDSIGARFEIEIRLSKGTAKNQFVHINVDSSDYVPYVETRESNYADVLAVKRNIVELINNNKSSQLFTSELDNHLNRWYTFENSMNLLKLNFDEILNDTSRFRTRDTRISFRLSSIQNSTITGHTNKFYKMEFKVEKGSEQTYAFYESTDDESKHVFSAITFADPVEQEKARVQSSVLIDNKNYRTNILNRSSYLPSDFIASFTENKATPEQLGVNLGNQTHGITKTEITDLVASDEFGSVKGKLTFNDNAIKTTDIEIFGFRTIEDQLEIAREHFSTFVGNKDLRINSATPTVGEVENGIVGFNNAFKDEYLKGMTYTFALSASDDKGVSTGVKQKATVTFTHTASTKSTTHSFFVVNNTFAYKTNVLVEEKQNVLTRFSEGNRNITINYLPSEIKVVNNVLDKEMLGLTNEVFAKTTFELVKASNNFGTIQALAKTTVESETTSFHVTFKGLRNSSQVEYQQNKELEILARNIRSLNGTDTIHLGGTSINSIKLPSDLASASSNVLKDKMLEQFVVPVSSKLIAKIVWEDWTNENGLSIRVMLNIGKATAYSKVYKVKG